jgi:two-component system sensor histidine kinase/response regulator
MNILIVEDEQPIQETLQEILELNGHTVVIANDGGTGISLAENLPDIILCDIGLPDMDGYEVLGAIRRMPACADIPFIFLTARVGREDYRRGMSLGGDDYITKPFSEEEIIEAINARIKRQQPLRERIKGLIEERQNVSGARWSHELLTPLHGVLGGLELIEMEVDTIKPEELKPLLGMIRVSAEQQLDLAQKLMFYYELEHRKTTAKQHKVQHCDVAAAIALGVNRAASKQDRPNDMSVHCEPGQISVFEGFFITAIAEVVENALQFSKAGQPVSVTGVCRDDRYLIEITNHGLGMTAEQCSGVAPFKQFNQKQLAQKGLGLGLSIARSVAELAGGHLTLQPMSEGGLLVRFDLPRI